MNGCSGKLKMKVILIEKRKFKGVFVEYCKVVFVRIYYLFGNSNICMS